MMILKEIEQAILDIIREVYKVEYVGIIKVDDIIFDDMVIGYTLSLSLHSVEQPLRISFHGSDIDFLKYIKQESETFDLVDSGKAEASFIMAYPKIKDIKEISEAGERMPQKSTYFYPKVICGFVFASINETEFKSPVYSPF